MAVKPKQAETIASEQTERDGSFDAQSNDVEPDGKGICTDPEQEPTGPEQESEEPEQSCAEPAPDSAEPELAPKSVERDTGQPSLEPEPDSAKQNGGPTSLEHEPQAVERECAEPEPESTCEEPAPETVQPGTTPASLEPEQELESAERISEAVEPEPQAAEPQAADPETERNTESPIEVIDPVSARNLVPPLGKRAIIIEDEQTGSVTVSYGDELVRVELNESSGDEFSDVEETEEQRILRESGAQIIEDDDDECEEELQTINIQLENTARKSVIRSPVDKNSETSEKQNTDKLLLHDKMQQSDKTSKEEQSPKASETTQKRKVSKLEQSIRKISNIRERENNSDSVQSETIGTISSVAHSKTDMPLVTRNNENKKESPAQNSSLPGDLTVATVEYGK